MERFKSFLIFFIPFLLFFYYFTDHHEHNLANTTHLAHGYVNVPEGHAVPAVRIFVTQDLSSTWLLEVETKNFAFTPKKIGANHPSYNEGHAHLYINGKKINRLYGKYYNLGKLEQGKNKIKVTLNSNNHKTLLYEGNPIEFSTVVKVAS